MKYHFIGDQGISMGGIKEYMAHLGNEVSGSDLKTGGHDRKNIDKSIDVVVRSSAVNPGSSGWVEVEEAEALGIKVLKRSELLGQITLEKSLVAVSGMHGKTTVTTMVGLLLIEAGMDPTVLVGERVKEFSNHVLRIGLSDWFVMEACEYDRSFLDFYPSILILTNIEEEHLDTYPGGIEEIKTAYIQYVKNVREGGTIIACIDDDNIKEVLERSETRADIIYYGRGSERYNDLGFDIKLPGAHNRLNALAVLALSDLLKIEREVVKEVLQNFSGAKRRFEFKGRFNGADVIDDYGHHPTEIKSTIAALAEKYSDRKKYVVFWPHQYKRVLSLLDQFSESFDLADEIILKPIFFVPGRDEVLDVSSLDLAGLIQKRGKRVRVLEKDDDIVELLRGEINDGCVVLTIGIPPVYKIAECLVAEEKGV